MKPGMSQWRVRASGELHLADLGGGTAGEDTAQDATIYKIYTIILPYICIYRYNYTYGISSSSLARYRYLV